MVVAATAGGETIKGSNVKSSTAAAYDDAFDDACDLGQCCMDPCYFIYVKITSCWKKRQRRRKNLLLLQSSSIINSNMTIQQKRQQEKWEALLKKQRFYFAMQQTMYYILIAGCWSVIFLRVYPMIDASVQVSNHHKRTGILVFGLCLSSWVLAKFASPGSITQNTYEKYDNYPYDGYLYHQPSSQEKAEMLSGRSSTTATTLQQQQRRRDVAIVARSKWDRYSGSHVPRFDHFCGWLGQSIGEDNYRFFLWFLFVHAAMVLYGTVITGKLIYEAAAGAAGTSSVSLFSLIIQAFHVDPLVTMVFAVMGMAVPLVGGFGSFHLWLVCRGMTTHECFKYKKMKKRKDAGNKKGMNRTKSSDEEQCDGGHDDHRLSSKKKEAFYNLGVVRNVHEVFFPRSMRQRRNNGNAKDQ